MAALTTEQIECMLSTLIANCEHVTVLGVHPADNIPMKVSIDKMGVRTLHSCVDNTRLRDDTHYCFVLNTDTHDSPGEHWLAFFYNHNTHALEYFDSFGMVLSMYSDVYAALEQCTLTKSVCRVNTLGMIQAVQSSVCGHYCVAFLYWRAKHTAAGPTLFSHSIALRGTAVERDKYIVERLRDLLSRRACAYDMLTRSAHSQACTCCRIYKV